MDIQVRLGTETDIDSLEQLYDNLNDYLAETINYPGWIKGGYPVREDAADGIDAGCLFVAVEHDEIIGSIILRPEPEPDSSTATGQAVFDNRKILSIHTFVISPKKLQHGIGKWLLEFAEQHAIETNRNTLRLDVYEKNLPAIGLYEKCGFQHIDTISLGLEEYGLDWFRLYEKRLPTKK